MATANAVDDRYVRLQGNVYRADINPATGLPLNGALNYLGNVKDGSFTLNTQSIKHNESNTGQGFNDNKIEIAKEGTLDLMPDSFLRRNLELAMYGSSSVQAASTVTNENVIANLGGSVRLANINLSSFTSLTIGGGTGATATVALVAGRLVFTVTAGGTGYASAPVITVTGGTGGAGATFTATVLAGIVTAITQNAGGAAYTVVPTGVVFTPVAASTLVLGTDYLIKNIRTGFIDFLATPATATLVNGIGLLANYVCGTAERVDAFKSTNKPFAIIVEGINTAQNDDPIIITFFRVRFDAAKNIKVISDDYQELSITGEILYSPTAQQFVRIEQLTANS
jgi:hypothetical protein